MNILKILGYVFLGCGTVFLIVATFIFFNVIIPISQIPFAAQQLNPVALTDCIPFLTMSVELSLLWRRSSTKPTPACSSISTPTDSSRSRSLSELPIGGSSTARLGECGEFPSSWLSPMPRGRLAAL